MSDSIPRLSISQLTPATSVGLGDELPLTQGSTGPGTGTTRRGTVQQVLGELPTLGYLQLQWANGAVVGNGEAFFCLVAPYGGKIESLDTLCSIGSFVVTSVAIAGTPVTGLSGLTVGAQANTLATGADTFLAGQPITVTIASASGSPSNAVLGLRVNWTPLA